MTLLGIVLLFLSQIEHLFLLRKLKPFDRFVIIFQLIDLVIDSLPVFLSEHLLTKSSREVSVGLFVIFSRKLSAQVYSYPTAREHGDIDKLGAEGLLNSILLVLL